MRTFSHYWLCPDESLLDVKDKKVACAASCRTGNYKIQEALQIQYTIGKTYQYLIDTAQQWCFCEMFWKLHWFPLFLLLLLRKSHKNISFLTFCTDHTNKSVYCTNNCEDLTWNIFPALGAAPRKEVKPTIESLEGNKGNDQTPGKWFVRKAGGEI